MNEQEQKAADCLLKSLLLGLASDEMKDFAKAYEALCKGFRTRTEAEDNVAYTTAKANPT